MSVYIVSGSDGRPVHIAFFESSARKWFEQNHAECEEVHHLEKYEPGRRGTEWISTVCLDHEEATEADVEASRTEALAAAGDPMLNTEADVEASRTEALAAAGDPMLNTEAVLSIVRAQLLDDNQTVALSLAGMTPGDFMQGAMSAIATMASLHADDAEPATLAAEILKVQDAVIAYYAEAHEDGN